MTENLESETIDHPSIKQLIKSGQTVGLVIEHEKKGEEDHYLLYCRYADQKTPIFTQRNTHRGFKNIDVAISWARTIGFSWVSFFMDINSKSSKKR